jgi:excisionase family DNA binding protein
MTSALKLMTAPLHRKGHMPKNSLSVSEVAALLGVAPVFIVRLTHRKIKAEKLPAIHVDGEMRFDSEQFHAWKKANWDEEAFPMLKNLRRHAGSDL